MTSALLVIDMVNDFVSPDGALPVPGAVDLVKPIISVLGKCDNVLFCNDNHDANDPEFEEYPPHCVAGTWGADLYESFTRNSNQTIIQKSTFSAFSNDLLDRILKRLDVHELYICGVATEVCIKQTVWSARDLGYRTHVLVDCIAGLEMKNGDIAESLMMMGYWEASPVKGYEL